MGNINSAQAPRTVIQAQQVASEARPDRSNKTAQEHQLAGESAQEIKQPSRALAKSTEHIPSHALERKQGPSRESGKEHVYTPARLLGVETLQLKRALALGDRVLIRNPGPFQSDIGHIINIGVFNITILTQDGKKVIRAAHNLIHLKDEHAT
jgi:hypothetical protein